MLKKRCISLFVENEVGTLAYISGLLSGKSYNMDSLTVGTTLDPTISRMTITLTSDDRTFEQIKKQLNRSVAVIKVVDFTRGDFFMKELMYVKLIGCDDKEMKRAAKLAADYDATVVECVSGAVLMESVNPESANDRLLNALQRDFAGRIEIVRGGTVAIEALEAARDEDVKTR